MNEVPRPAPDATDAAPSTAPASPATGPIDVRTLAREANARLPGSLLNRSRAAEKTEVHDVLRENFERAGAAGLNEVPPRSRRPSRRKRDYFLMLGLGNAVLAVGTYIMPIFGLAGVILFNVSLTWVVWFVMDDY